MKLPAASCGVSGAELRRSPTRLRSLSYGAVHLAIHTCSKLQGILAKANNSQQKHSPAARSAAMLADEAGLGEPLVMQVVIKFPIVAINGNSMNFSIYVCQS